jgi:8-oxo-dGTP diphosphatase
MNKLIRVAVGVICNSEGKILIAQRAASAHQGGLWEFPGGKVDQEESVTQALARELEEELGLHVMACEPLIQIRHDYSDKSVLLDVYTVTKFTGDIHGKEGQPIQWVTVKELDQFEFPAANRPIITAIRLPEKYLITGDFIDENDFIRRLDSALNKGIKLVQIRINHFETAEHLSLIQRAVSLSDNCGAQLLINASPEEFRALENRLNKKIDLHLNSFNASQHLARPIDKYHLLGVSCHNIHEIEQAKKIDADYILLSPVKTTATHPDAMPLGWERFAELVKQTQIPVYALGGLGEADIQKAKNIGAQGVAGISSWWQ